MENLLQLSYLGRTNFIVAIKSLSLLANEKDLVTSKTLTDKLGVESSFIRKVLAKLMQEELVEGFGGRYGGYKIIGNPEEITLYDVYIAIVKDAHPNEINNNIDDIDKILLGILGEAQQKLRDVLSGYTISEITKGQK